MENGKLKMENENKKASDLAPSPLAGEGEVLGEGVNDLTFAQVVQSLLSLRNSGEGYRSD